MKINDLEFHLVAVGCTALTEPVRSLLVRLTTDSGLEGWGESGLGWRSSELLARREAAVAAPGRPEHLRYRGIARHGGAWAAAAAWRPSEMACWDLIGRAVGQPLCRLLGGEYRRRIPLAVRLPGRRPERLARLAREMAAQGFRCQVLNSSGEVEADRRMLLAVRESVGDRPGTAIGRPGTLRHRVCPRSLR